MQKILIANRGEIACRIVRTCERMNIATVAVYSMADRGAQHVQAASESYRIPVEDNVQAYLSIPDIIRIAKETSADGIHPGYGFLAENTAFSEACRDAGITFIGPTAEAMKTLGDKNDAREQAIAKKVPIAQGISLPDDPAGALSEAERFIKDNGLPALIKAAAGGGGKGMRKLDADSDVRDSIERAGREALKLFGNGSLFIEQFVSPARHVEIQFISDTTGAVGILFDRDCSLQRSNQKIIEEAPAPNLNPETRQALYEHTRNLVTGTGYVGVGTAEFLINDSDQIFFLEINTRLQVEHPVTECITGLDLVELQIKAARGDAVVDALPQAPLKDIHAIELRLCAESSDGQFFPSSGRLLRCSFPADNSIRIDSGYVEGDFFPPYFDSLLAKIIVSARSREAAIDRAISALDATEVFGVSCNSTFLKTLLSMQETIAAPRTASVGTLLESYEYKKVLEKAAIRLLVFEIFSATKAPLLWRSSYSDTIKRWYQAGDIELEVSFELIDGETARVSCGECNSSLNLSKTNRTSKAVLACVDDIEERITALKHGSRFWLQCIEGAFCFETRLPSKTSSGTLAFSSTINAELPGQILAVKVTPGQLLAAGDLLVTLESMKMEHELTAPTPARVKTVHVADGQQVSIGDLLLELEAVEDARS